MVNDTSAEVPQEIQRSRKRSRIIWLGTVFALVACGVQLFSIQIVRGAELKEQGRIVRTSASSIEAPRGTILDASGNVLVDSVQTYHIAVNQRNILEYRHIEDGVVVGKGPAEAAKQLAPLLEMDPSELGGMMLGDSTYVYLDKDVDAATYREIRKLNVYGIEWEPNFERQYPGGNTAATIVGSVGAEGQGNSGLEFVFDDLLTGVPGEESYEIGPTGAVIPGAKIVTEEAEPGATLHLTIDADLQHAVQRELDEATKKYGASWGAAVILDVETSKVLTLADSGSKDPTDGPQTSRAVQMVYEPGSVGKVLTMATALENGTITPTSEFQISDSYTIGEHTFTDLGDYGTALRTATGVLAQSSNTGTLMIGQLSSDEERYEMLQRFGLGTLTGIELPGESAGILTEPSTWDGRTKYTTMFGQGYAMTALQAATIVATIGNDGVYQAPRVVEGWTTADGVYEEAKLEAPRQVLRSEVASTLTTMMESVVADPDVATGGLAAVDGYRVAAKTGSAEIGNGRIAASVIGLLPADNPQLAIAVVLYEPSPGLLAGQSAAPLFSTVASEAVRSLGVAPSSEPARLFPSIPASVTQE